MQAANSSLSSPIGDRRKKRNIFINLTKLQTGTLQSLNDEAVAIETILPPAEATFIREERARQQEIRKSKKWKESKKDEKPKRKIIKDVKQFFGPVVGTAPSPEPEFGENEEIPVINFRLRGLRKPVCFTDPTMEMIISRREAGQDVRIAEDDYHYKLETMPKPVVQKRDTLNNMQRILNKTQGTMGLSCLNAIQQAYTDREKLERKTARLEAVIALKEQRENAKQRIKLYKDEQRNKALQRRATDHKELVETLEKREMLRLSYLDKRTEFREKSSHHTREKRREMTFMSDFTVQNTSVSNALLRHDRQAQIEDKLQEKMDLVTGYKFMEKEQQDIVKKYMEHRTLMRQTESAMSKATLDTRMLQEANDRIMQAKQRVAQQKAKSANVTAALPTVTTPSLPPVVHRGTPGQSIRLDRWNTDMNMTVLHGRMTTKSTPITPAAV